MKINLRKTAVKDLKKIAPIDKNRILTKIRNLSQFPDVSNCKKLTNFSPAYRVRVGNYRILFDVIDDRIEVGRILQRKESYR